MVVEDLADKVDDLICAWDKVVGTDLETVVILLLGMREYWNNDYKSWMILSGWLVFGGVIFLISHLIYSTLGTEDEVSSPPPPDLVPTLAVSPPLHPDHPVAVGHHQHSVIFVNHFLEFLYSNTAVREDILDRWRHKLSEFARRSSEEVRFSHRVPNHSRELLGSHLYVK